MKITPTIFNPQLVIAAQSTRHGGVSTAPFDTLNLGLSVKDNKESVFENRSRFFGSLGFTLEQISVSKQIHGSEVLCVWRPSIYEGYDAQITNVPGICLAVSVADCVPVLIHDPVTHSVAAVHAGWRGTASNIVGETIKRMKKEFGTRPGDCVAFVGACISMDHFEVGDEVAAAFSDEVKVFYPEKKKHHVNLKLANQLLLEEAGLEKWSIEVSSYCTWKNNDLFFSHRKSNGNTGRMMAAIGLKSI